MSAPACTVVDFETEPIGDRPAYPPKPVGVAVGLPGNRPRYYAFGHPTANNCTREQAVAAVAHAYDLARTDGVPVLAFNYKFDGEVAEVHFGLPMLPPDLFRDAMFESFLCDPYANELDLKSLGKRWCGIEPEEQRELRDWVWEHVPETRRWKKKWASRISLAPGDLVGLYAAQGDAGTTRALHEALWPRIVRDGMEGAYLRERRLVRHLVDAERRGMRVDVERLERDVAHWEEALCRLDEYLGKYLGKPGLELDRNEALADALEDAGKLDEWIMTEPTDKNPDGARSTSIKALKKVLKDPVLLEGLSARGLLATCLRSHGRGWLESARRSPTGDRVSTTWNQVKKDAAEGGLEGARTGRASSSPNLQNIPKRSKPLAFSDEEHARLLAQKDAKGNPKFKEVWRVPAHLREVLPELPNMRTYVLPLEKKGWLVVGDESQHELRILANYERGDLYRAFLRDPHVDLHQFTTDQINAAVHAHYSRWSVKQTVFAGIYGSGNPKLAEMLETTLEEAKALRKAYRAIFPDVDKLSRSVRERAAAGRTIRTGGGRVYGCEPPYVWRGKTLTFEYKLLNTLIQGTAADCFKESLLAFSESEGSSHWFLQVHDELAASVPTRKRTEVKREARRLRAALEGVKMLGVPLVGELKEGPNFGELVPLDLAA